MVDVLWNFFVGQTKFSDLTDGQQVGCALLMLIITLTIYAILISVSNKIAIESLFTGKDKK